jgi:uncharacterized protein YukE
MGDELKALPPLPLQPYTDLAAAFRSLAKQIGKTKHERHGFATTAEDGWTGRPVAAFTARFTQGETDADELADSLNVAADLVDKGDDSLMGAAIRENERRRLAREFLAAKEKWIREHPDKGGFSGLVDDVKGWFESDDWEGRVGLPLPSADPEPMLQKIATAVELRRQPTVSA